MENLKLEQIGLTKNEAKIYLALVNIGTASAGELIQRTGFHRNIVYDNLRKLMEKGLVSSIKKERKTFFEVGSVEGFLKMIADEEKLISAKKKAAQKIANELDKLKKLTKPKEEATIYQGYKGVTAILDEVLKENEHLYSFGASAKVAEEINKYYKYFFPRWHKIRIKKKIFLNIIYSEDNRDRAKEIAKLRYTNVKILPNEFASPISTGVFGNKVIIITWAKEPFAFLIRSKYAAAGMKNYFNLLWKIAKKI